MNEFIAINPENKSGKIKLNDIVMQPVMDRLIGEIGKIFGAQAAQNGADFGELMNCAENAIDELEIEIHSPGGSVLDGYTLYNEIKSLRARGVVVTAKINSLAASMASVIAMAADKILMVPNGQMMIHEVSQGVRGNAKDLRKAADLCEQMSAQIADIYAERTGQPVDSIREMMKEETWMNAKRALQLGFIDEVFDIRQPSEKTTGMSLLAKLFPGNDEVSKLEASIAENDSLRAELEQANAKLAEVSNLTESVALKNIEIENLTSKLADAEKLANDNAQLVKEIQSQVLESKEQIAIAENASASKAVEILASVGQPEPVPVNETATVNHAEVFAKLTGTERTEYYAKYSEEIRASLTK